MHYCIRCNRTPILSAGYTCIGCRAGLLRPHHTCDTARSGSERSENTCPACAEEMSDRRRKGPYPALGAATLPPSHP